MKKFFALMLVAAMLSAASAAMAASPSITVSPSTVSVAAAGTASVTLTATAGHNGQFGAYTVTGVDWAAVLDNTIVFAPDASVTPGSYTATVTVTETYTDGPAGHGSIATETATATIPVTVTRAAAGTYTVVRLVETVTSVVTRNVTVISRSAQGSTVVQTFTETVRTVAQTITTAVLTQVEGYTPQLVSYWSQQTATIETARSTTVAAIESNPTTRNAIFPGLPAAAVVTPRANTSLVSVMSSVSSTTTVEKKLAAATFALDGAGKALSAQEAVQATESGTYSFVKTFGEALFGTKIKGHRGRQNRGSSSGSFAASAVDNEGVAFLNSKGEKTEVIPGYENSQDIMPGYVTMLVVMDAGEVYEPVIYATEADLASNDIAVESAPVSVDIQQVQTTVVREVVTVDESGKTTVTEIKEASDTVVTAMKAVMGDALVMVPVEKYADVAQATIATDDTEAAYQNLHVAARTSAVNNLDPGLYYMPITFQQLASGKSIKSGAAFTFYPDGVTDGIKSFVKVFDSTGAEVTNPASMVASAGNTGYLAFAIDADGVRDADGDSSLANPTLTLEMADGGDTPTPTPPDPGETGVGSSSGGCSAGSAVLALALLGAFIARKK